MGRLLDKLASGDRIIGTNDSLGGLPLAEVLATAGLDFACIDTMFCAFDWEHLQAWSRAALLYGMDPLMRVPAHPWSGSPDSHLAAQVARAFGIGMNGVYVSLNTPSEVRELLEVSRQWHKNLHLHLFTRETFETYAAVTSQENLLVPLIESQQAVDNLPDILALEGLRAIGLGMSDLSRVLGVPFNYEDSRLWDLVDETVKVATERGVAVIANPGYESSRDLRALQDRISQLYAHGIRGVKLQNSGYMVQWLYRSILETSVLEGDVANRTIAP